MSDLALVGIDLGKHTFHLHGQDKPGRELFRKKLSRQQMMRFFANLPACTVVMEACAGAHFVARELTVIGHQAKLISPQFVRPFVKGNKNDFIDAQAICEAASRPTMRFVSPKTEAQQILSVLHRLRESLIRDRTKAVNQMHGFLLEFGISLPKGLAVMKRLSSVLVEHELPARLTVLLQRLHDHFVYLDGQIKELDKDLAGQLADDDLGSRLLSMPCVADHRQPAGCRNGRWPAIRLQPRFCCLSGLGTQNSTAPAARQTCWASASVTTRTCAACWCNAPGSTCSTLNVKKGRWPTGYARCLRDVIPTWSPVRWPTN